MSTIAKTKDCIKTIVSNNKNFSTVKITPKQIVAKVEKISMQEGQIHD